MKEFLQMSRAPFFTAIITPTVVAAALAYRETGNLNMSVFLLTILALVSAHAGANLLNDYYDYKQGADANNKNRNPFSGGSPHLVEGIKEPKAFLYSGIACFITSFLSGLAVILIIERGLIEILIMGSIGFFIGIFYTAPPVKLSYRGLGEISIFAAFGILPFLGVYYVFTGEFGLLPLAASLPLAFLICDIILINEFPDYESDKAANKRHLVVIFGKKGAVYIFILIMLAAFGSVIGLSLSGVYGYWGFIAMAGMATGIPASYVLIRNYDNPPALLPAQALTIATHLITGAFLATAAFLGK